MPELSTPAWILVAASALMVGISKTGMPGLGILPALLMAHALPAQKSVGALLGILILGDLFAAAYHRHNARWSHMPRLLPAALGGIVTGYFLLKVVTDAQLKPIIGVIVLAMLAVNYWRTKTRAKDLHIPTQWWFAAALGFLAGLTSMMANAAGPVMVIYLLAMRLPKVEFVGTTAWFFFVVNWLKVPFSMNLEMMTAQSIRLNLMLLPLIALGALAGMFLLKRIGQKAFDVVVRVLAVAAAVKLLF
ncbi:MAG: sulfite exporter TauE/SafE family protein [Phycisphaerales bacterium]|nr:MAG: sulfite exporter TauE/SafE family protein [Phycisphaerales bacterium]